MKITDAGMVPLRQSLKNLTSLKDLTIKFELLALEDKEIFNESIGSVETIQMLV